MSKINFILFVAFVLGAVSTSLSGQVYVDASASGSNDGTSWANAYSDLSTAIMNTPSGGEVWVAAGVYYPGGATPSRDASFTLPFDMKLYGGFAGTESDLSERNVENNLTRLSGDHNGDDITNNFTTNRTDNSRHVMFLTEDISSETIIDGFTISNGSTDDDTSSDDLRRGGGVLTYGTPTITNCVFTQNYGWFGGGLYPRGSDPAIFISISDCTFITNSAGFGAGIYLNQNAGEILNCHFQENTAQRTAGGVYNSTANGTLVDNCTFELNLANEFHGAGLANFSSPSTISGCDFTRNNSITRRGGGIYITESNATVSACTFEGNFAGTTAGAIHITDGDTLARTLITDCEFTLGTATWGGAITVYGDQNTVEVANCEMNNNTAINNGGAIYLGFGGSVIINNSEIIRNEANNGGAIGSQNDLSSATIIDSDISLNDATRGGAINMFNGNDSLLIGNPSVEIIRSMFNFNDCIEQGGVLNLSDADLTVASSLFTNNTNTSSEGAGGVMSLNTSGTIQNTYSLVNNTFYNNAGAVGSVIGNWTDSTGVSTLTIQNNIFSASSIDAYAIEDGTPAITSRGGNMSDDESLVAFASATNDTHNEMPQFSSPGFGEFNLLQDSPAINTGIEDGAPELDITGAERVFGVDKGAYEFTESVAVEDLKVSLLQLAVYPNPTSEVLQYALDNTWIGPVQLCVKNIMGQVIHTSVIQKNDEQFEGSLFISGYHDGAYLLNLRTDTHSVTRTFIKQ